MASTQSACSYHFQGTRNPLRELGIERIYVAGFTNGSFRPGIEQLFSTSMVREIQKSRAFRLVNDESEADAILSGAVSGADSNVSSLSSVSLSPTKSVNVAAEFSVSVSCVIQLTDRAGRVIFTQTVSDNKTYPAVVRTGDLGSTGPLINESEQRLAIQFLAGQMMSSVYQRIIDTF
jgi:hypothetical protein